MKQKIPTIFDDLAEKDDNQRFYMNEFNMNNEYFQSIETFYDNHHFLLVQL